MRAFLSSLSNSGVLRRKNRFVYEDTLKAGLEQLRFALLRANNVYCFSRKNVSNLLSVIN